MVEGVREEASKAREDDCPQGLIPQKVSGDVETLRHVGEGIRGPWANGSQILLRKPDAGDPHVRFDERDVETEHGKAIEAPAGESAGNR